MPTATWIMVTFSIGFETGLGSARQYAFCRESNPLGMNRVW